jgi:DNA-binding transcriptional LysR family regulator
MDKLTQLNAFVKIAEAKSFSLAAEQLGVANSTVSKWIHNLELTFGCQLLVRKGNNVHLSKQGEIYHRHAVDVLASYHRLVNVQHTSINKGKVRLGIPRSYGEKYVFPLLIEFAKLHPDIQLDVQMNDNKESIFKQGYDLVLRIGEITERDVVAREVGRVPRVLVASASAISSVDCDDKTFVGALPIVLHSNCGIGYFSQVLDRKIHDSKIRMRLNSSKSALKAILSTDAMSILPYFEVAEKLESGVLVHLLPSCRLPTMPLNVIYPQRELMSSSAKVLLGFLLERKDLLMSQCTNRPLVVCALLSEGE